MDRKFLEDFGLEKEQIDQILNRVSNEIGQLKSSQEQELEKKKQEYESLESEYATAKETIKTLEKSDKDNETLQAEIEKYKHNLEAVKAQSLQDKIDMNVKLALTNAGAIEPKAVMPFINMDSISVAKDGSITGIDEQIQSITSDDKYSFLFKSQEIQAPVNPNIGGYNPDSGYTEVSDPTAQGQPINYGKLLGKERSQNRQNNSSDTSQSYYDSLA